MSVEGAAAGKRLHLFFVVIGILRETYFLFYIFYTFYLSNNERFNHSCMSSSYFYKFLHSVFSSSIFYKTDVFLRLQKWGISLSG